MEVICSFRRAILDDWRKFCFLDKVFHLVDTGKDYGLVIKRDNGVYECDTVASDMPIIYRVLIDHIMVNEFIWQDVIYETKYELAVMHENFTLSVFQKRDVLKYDYTHKNIKLLSDIL